jgi:hypothetical protein
MSWKSFQRHQDGILRTTLFRGTVQIPGTNRAKKIGMLGIVITFWTTVSIVFCLVLGCAAAGSRATTNRSYSTSKSRKSSALLAFAKRVHAGA